MKNTLHVLNYSLRALGFLLLLAVVFFLIPLAKPYIGHLSQYGYLEKVITYSDGITDSVKGTINKFIPTDIKGYDLTRGLLIFILLVLHARVSGLQYRVSSRMEYYHEEEQLRQFMEDKHISADSGAMQTLQTRLDNIKNASKKDRKSLVKDFMDIKHQLDIMGRNLAFLSVDVVGSTSLKAGVDPITVAYLFDEYNKMLIDILKQNHSMKFSSTPDGIMACFASADEAVKTAQILIQALPQFNDKVKFERGELKVRCGINIGFVYYDESEPLEHLSDRSIDVAGHMQKYAEPNTIYASKNIIGQLTNAEGFSDIHRDIEGSDVYRWEVKRL